ncbi:MAG: HlyC/CorC family transporter [Oscillospiraceae bacterium]|nr:HlyC/CorC family transporter [Oscillospiraceae bacterium]
MKYAVIAFLLLLSAFFSASETAFSSVNRIRLKQLAQTDKRAARALNIAENFDKALTAILVGNNIVNILSASLGTVIATSLFGKGGVGIATAVMTVLVLIFGEIVPKTYAKENAERFTMFASALLSVIMVILTPVTALFSAIKRLISKDKAENPYVTEDELKFIINEIEEEGVLEERESDLVKSALEIDDKPVSQVLIPRVRIVAVDEDTPIDKVKEVFFAEKYSRLPVYEKTIDNITGFIHERDFFNLLETENPQSISPIIHDVMYITEFDTVSAALSRMQKEKIHMAVVKDQYGGTYGMVTMEDLIEELLGEIYDEADEADDRFRKISDNVYEVRSELGLRDFLKFASLPQNRMESRSNTVGGYVMEKAGIVPSVGDKITADGFIIEVLDARDNRIVELRITDTSSDSESP